MMMDSQKNYLLTIAIPTKNRQIYACDAVRQILAISPDIQIVITDNSDDRSLEKMLKQIGPNEQIKYYYIEETIPGVRNYDLAASLAEGEYFCSIGDDDGVLPAIYDCVRWMKKCGVDAVMPSRNSNYVWPYVDPETGRKKGGRLYIGEFSGRVEKVDPTIGLISLLEGGGQNFPIYHMAGSYHCVVSMRCMDKVKEKTGCYYGGLSPDIYSASCLSLLPDLCFYTMDYPLTIPGACPMSSTAQSARGEHVGKLETAPHLKGMKSYDWDAVIPRYYSVQSIWAETLLTGVRAMGRDDLIEKHFDTKKLCEAMWKENPNKREEIEESFRSMVGPDQILLWKREEQMINAKRAVIKFLKHVKSGLRILQKKRAVYNTLTTCSQATATLFAYFKNRKETAVWQQAMQTISKEAK